MVGSRTIYYVKLSIKYGAVPQHGSLSVYTLSLKAHQLQEMDFYLPKYGIDDFKEPLSFDGHGSWITRHELLHFQKPIT